MELDLLNMYYCCRVNDLAQKKRKAGEEFRDKDFVFPVIKKLENIAKGGKEEFFQNNYVVSLGMTLGDYESYIGKMMMSFIAYVKDEDLLGRLWE